MTQGLIRLQHSGQSHFVTFSCYRRQTGLNTPAIRTLFLEALERSREQFSLFVYGYVVMPEHIHLLVSEPGSGTLADAIHFLKLSSAKQRQSISGGHADSGHFWQKRYYDRNVRSYSDFTEKPRYIHRNPVKRGLCEKPEDWPWSSFRHYAFGEAGSVEIESEWTARRRTGKKTEVLSLEYPASHLNRAEAARRRWGTRLVAMRRAVANTSTSNEELQAIYGGKL